MAANAKLFKLLLYTRWNNTAEHGFIFWHIYTNPINNIMNWKCQLTPSITATFRLISDPSIGSLSVTMIFFISFSVHFFSFDQWTLIRFQPVIIELTIPQKLDKEWFSDLEEMPNNILMNQFQSAIPIPTFWTYSIGIPRELRKWSRSFPSDSILLFTSNVQESNRKVRCASNSRSYCWSRQSTHCIASLSLSLHSLISPLSLFVDWSAIERRMEWANGQFTI